VGCPSQVAPATKNAPSESLRVLGAACRAGGGAMRAAALNRSAGRPVAPAGPRWVQ
jgi:hypothetical protein